MIRDKLRRWLICNRYGHKWYFGTYKFDSFDENRERNLAEFFCWDCGERQTTEVNINKATEWQSWPRCNNLGDLRGNNEH